MNHERYEVEVRGLRVSARVAGKGRPVVLLHGIPGSGHVWRRVGEALAESHRVITPDLLGFGHSSRSADIERLWVPGQAEAVVSLLHGLGVAGAVFVAHDFGGPVTSGVLQQRPGLVEGLVLGAANVFGDTPIPFPLSLVSAPAVGEFFGRLLMSRPALAMMVRQGGGPGFRPEDAATSVGDADQALAIRLIFVTALRELRARYADVERTFAQASIPCEVVWGDRDPFFSAAHGRRTAALFRAAHFELVAGAGHFLPEERPEQMVAAVTRLERTLS